MKLSWLPNALSVMRILLVPPSVLTLLAGRYDLTLMCFGCAAVSDGLDGWLAKTFGWTSRLGKILDPIADKLLLVSLYLALALVGAIPVWLTVVVVLRDVVIVLGAAVYRWLIGYIEGHPTAVSKLNTLIQLVFVLLVITRMQWPIVPESAVTWLGAAVFVTTIVSGLDYVLTYARAAIRARRTQS
ncbi:MAG: CDP-alcohol phosphatidyltransferase family protein [Pseudomonadota bacterium]|jgi:cardiolipin synthase